MEVSYKSFCCFVGMYDRLVSLRLTVSIIVFIPLFEVLYLEGQKCLDFSPMAQPHPFSGIFLQY